MSALSKISTHLANLPNFLNDPIFMGLVDSVLAAIILFCAAMFTNLIFARRYDTKKHQAKFRSRVIYISICLFALIILKIWIQGLEHFFTMLSIVAAGLVITNKETIMNFVGWLIINWRGIFVEGDYIKIEELSGYVHTIGPLFFKIYEADEIGIRQTTGKSIKIPNGLIITKPIITYSPDTNLCRYKTECLIPYDSDLNPIKDLFAKAISEVLHDCYKDDKTYCHRYIKDHNKELAKLIDLHPKVRAEPAGEGEKGIKISIIFFCYPINHRDIEQDFWTKIFALQKAQKLHLLGDNLPCIPEQSPS